ncbi:MAG: metallophosphoesterase [Lentisphaeria bacterium]|nr:metallophosphoesterase [Lentisphaeria bacterium]
MKLLCLSDLHLRSEAVVAAIDSKCLSPFLGQVAATVAEVSPDAAVVTGDTVSPAQVRLLSAALRTFIPADLPVIATLGNHEFWGRTFEDTLAKLKEQTLADPNIFYLDLNGAVELGGVNFVGGTLFFDGSMRIRDSQRVDQWDGWQDWRIVDIESRYMEINAYYVDMIRAKMKPGMPTALCTHHVPHVLLNGHAPGHYSFYTGMKDLVHELPFDPAYGNYLICGHTHRRVIGEVVPGFMGVNVGGDYGVLQTFTLEV